MMKFVSIALPMLLVVASCSDEKHEEKPGKSGAAAHGHEGPHGGHILEVGDHVAHLEVMHDESAGKMTIYVLGPDAKSAFTAIPPRAFWRRTAKGCLGARLGAKTAYNVDG